MYGSDFFYPTAASLQQQQQQHEYDNLTFPQTFSSDYYERFPILVECQRCSQSLDRSLLRDNSCQVPSDDEFSRKNEQSYKRSSLVYISPATTPPLCHPPLANSLLAPYHLRRQRSLASAIYLHNRSKSAPSAASSSTLSSMSSRNKHFSEKRNKHLLPSLSPLQTVPTVSSLGSESVPVSSTPSTTALLRSIKTSIYAMKKRLKDIRRLSEVGICC